MAACGGHGGRGGQAAVCRWSWQKPGTVPGCQGPQCLRFKNHGGNLNALLTSISTRAGGWGGGGGCQLSFN